MKYGPFFIIAIAMLPFLGCSEPDELSCVTVSSECAALYEPSFQNVFSQTLAPGCAVAGQCHGSDAARGGLVISEFHSAYSALLDNGKVIPSDPKCSELIIRMESKNRNIQMPPGNTLSAAERCSVIQWIAAGAKKE